MVLNPPPTVRLGWPECLTAVGRSVSHTLGECKARLARLARGGRGTDRRGGGLVPYPTLSSRITKPFQRLFTAIPFRVVNLHPCRFSDLLPL